MVFEIRLNLVLHIFLRRLLLGVGGRLWPIDLFLTKIPQVDLTIIYTRCQLVDIWQILDTLDEIVDEPRGVFGPVFDILFLLLSSGHFFLLTATWPRSILVGLVIRIVRLLLIFT